MAYLLIIAVVASNYLSIYRITHNSGKFYRLYYLPSSIIVVGAIIGALLFSYHGDDMNRNYMKMIFVFFISALYILQWAILGIIAILQSVRKR